MAIKTFQTAVNATAYTKVGSNVLSISVSEVSTSYLRAVVTDVGDAAPLADNTDYVLFDGTYSHNGAAVDVWILSPDHATTVYGQTP